MATLKLTVNKTVEEELSYAVPLYRKFSSENQVRMFDSYRYGKIISVPENRAFETVVYVKVTETECMIVTKRVNKRTRTVVYDIERGAVPEQTSKLVYVIDVQEASIDAEEFDAVVASAVAFVNGSSLDSDLA